MKGAVRGRGTPDDRPASGIDPGPEPRSGPRSRPRPRRQRLALALLAVVAMLAATLLAMSAIREQASLFYTPADVARAAVAPGKALRLGGMVERGSLRRLPDGVTIRFRVVDGIASVPVRFSGVTPALFREGSGVVADGRLDPAGLFLADQILAKHDERYMPPEVAGAMHKSESLKR